MTATSGGIRSRIGSFVGALASVLAIGGVAPWLLVVAARVRFGGGSPWFGVPPPTEWAWQPVRRALTDQLTEETITDLVVRTALLVAWAAVLVLLATIVAEVVHMLRHGGLGMPDVRGLGAAQSVARIVAAGLLVVVPTISSPVRALADHASGRPLVVGSPAAAPSAPVASLTGEQPGHHARRADVEGGPVDVLVRERSAGEPNRYVVRPGDSVYAIAERFAGPGTDEIVAYAEEILDRNLGRPMPDGRRFENAALVDVGWVLELPAPPTSEPTASAESTTAAVHVVGPDETLWSIADDELGDPDRWPEIYDANHGRVFEDGRTLDDPSHIHPGWELDLPADDGPPASAGAPPPPVADGAVTDRDGPSAPDDVVAATDDLAAVDREHAAESSDRSRRLADRATAGAVPNAIPDDDVVEQQVAEPVGPASSEATPAAPDRPTNRWIGAPSPLRPDVSDDTERAPRAALPDASPVPGRQFDPDPGDDDGIDRDADETTSGRGQQLLTVERTAMLSVGVLALLGVRRRNRLRRARPGEVPPAVSGRAASTERALRAIDPGDRCRRVDAAVRAAAMSLARDGERPVALLVDDDAVELVASGPTELGPDWEPTDDGNRWRRSAELSDELPTETSWTSSTLCPTLVQLGRTTDDADVFVDLEALGAVEVGGPGDRADAIVTAVAATLASSVLAEVTTLVGVGIGDAAFLRHRHHVPARDSAEAFRRAAAAIGSLPTDGRNTFGLRALATGGEAWEPAVVLVGAAVGPIVPPADRTGLALVSASPIHGPSSRLEPDGDAWILRPLGLRLLAVGLPADDLAAVVSLVDSVGPPPAGDTGASIEIGPARRDGTGQAHLEGREADRPGDDDLTLVPPPDLPADDGGPGASDQQTVRPPVLVRLLGPVRIESADGRPAEIDRSKSTELVAWLATHRDRSTRTAARTALWELDVRDATFANVVSTARRALARLVEPPPGDEWVGRTLTEALPLHPLVRTDADLLREALDAARAQPPEQAIRTLRPAVELIVGLPFEGTNYLWPEAEGIASELVVLATSAAAELAAHHLSTADVDGVFEATGRGLRVLPGHEVLVGLRMRAHARVGDRAGVRHEWEQYERVITADPWSDGEPSEDLVELCRALLAR